MWTCHVWGSLILCRKCLYLFFFLNVPLHTINSHTFLPTLYASKFLQWNVMFKSILPSISHLCVHLCLILSITKLPESGDYVLRYIYIIYSYLKCKNLNWSRLPYQPVTLSSQPSSKHSFKSEHWKDATCPSSQKRIRKLILGLFCKCMYHTSYKENSNESRHLTLVGQNGNINNSSRNKFPSNFW